MFKAWLMASVPNLPRMNNNTHYNKEIKNSMNTKSKIIAIDTGNRYMKTEHFSFTSGLVLHGSTPPAVSTVDTIKYNGQYYSLTAARDAYRRDKTVDEVYKVLSMAAIAKELLHDNPNAGRSVTQNVTLALGLPIAHLQNMRERYAAYFKGENGAMDFEFNGIKFHIIVDSVEVWPQGYAAAIVDRESFTEASDSERAYIIDIGGYTTDVSMLSNGHADMSYCESINMGVIHLLNKVKVAVQEECGVEIDDIAAESLLKDGIAAKSNPTLVAVVQKTRKEYTDTLIRTLREKGIDFVTSYLIFMGGGSMMMEGDIRSAVKHQMIHFIPSINANATGYAALTQALQKRASADAPVAE